MTEAILIFTFSPVQGFIAEARRAGDLYAGSHILVKLATAAANAIGINHLVYPTDLTQDAPNKLVAKVPYDRAAELAENAKAELIAQWQKFVVEAHRTMVSFQPRPDSTWQKIWDRQTGMSEILGDQTSEVSKTSEVSPKFWTHPYWECHWAFAPYDGQDYWQAYQTASRALDAAKRTRRFFPAMEIGLKDTLSGQRSALRIQSLDAKEYWNQVSVLNYLTAATLRPNGRERLDALGVVKRFGLSDESTFLSVGSVATADFLVEAKKPACVAELNKYRQTVEALLGRKLHRPRPQDSTWPYDGDLFFEETLTTNRLEDSYDLKNPALDALKEARDALKELCTKIGWSPNAYYAILVLDGDGMGERANQAAQVGEAAHREFSHKLSEFARGVRETVMEHLGQPIYSGGDDVLALAPVSTSLKIGQALQSKV